MILSESGPIGSNSIASCHPIQLKHQWDWETIYYWNLDWCFLILLYYDDENHPSLLKIITASMLNKYHV